MQRKILSIAFILLLGGMGSAAIAAEGGLAAAKLLKMGIIELERGNFQQAAHELSKAYMLDPNNEEVIHYLQQLGLNAGIYGQEISGSSSPVEDFSQQLESYQQKIEKLQQENSEKEEINQILQENQYVLRENLEAREAAAAKLRSQYSQLERQAEEQSQLREVEIRKLERAARQKSGEVKRLNTNLVKMQDRLAKQITTANQKGQNMREVREDLKATKRRLRQEKYAYEREVHRLESEFTRMKVKSSQANINQREYVKNLRDTLQKNNVQLSRLKDQLLFTDYKLTNSETVNIRKNKKVADLKDTILTLEKELAYLQSRVSNQHRFSAPGAVKPKADPNKDKLLQRQDELILELKEQLADARIEMERISRLKGPESEEGIEDLDERLQEMRSRVREKDASLTEAEEDYQQLQKRMQDTQQQLDLVEGIMQEKDGQIEELEKQLEDALIQFDQLDEESLNLK